MISADFHTHTSFSTDAQASPRSMIEGAIERGLSILCITDHQDVEFPGKEGMFRLDTEQYVQTLLKLKEEYEPRLDLRIGVEIGLQPMLGPWYKAYAARYPFDFIIGSVHVVNGLDPYEKKLFRERGDAEAYAETFRETLTDIQAISDFDVLGHIDYVVRYGIHQDREYSYEQFAPYIDDILRYLIAHGKGIELNTAGFKYGLSFAHPHPSILKRYKELGGEIITVGSDGHRPEHLAYDFEKVTGILRDAGFKYYTEFKERKPIFKQLP